MSVSEGYTGVDVLEVLQDARKYNTFLVSTVSLHATGKKRLLDFGAGIGTFAQSLRDCGFNVSCVEPDTRMAKRLVEAKFPTFASVPANGTFDLIYTLNVLEHIADDQAVINSFLPALAPGGKVYVYVPAFQSLFSAFDQRVGHLRRYRRSELVAKIKAAGFSVQSARYVDSLGYFAALAYRLIGDGKGSVSPRSVCIYDTWLFPLSRWCDLILGRFIGKNLEIVATPRSQPI